MKWRSAVRVSSLSVGLASVGGVVRASVLGVLMFGLSLHATYYYNVTELPATLGEGDYWSGPMSDNGTYIAGGFAPSGGGDWHVVRWHYDGGQWTLTDLGVRPRISLSLKGINDSGSIAGFSREGVPVLEEAWVYTDTAGAWAELAGITTTKDNHASDINNAGVIAGYSAIPTGQGHAVVWDTNNGNQMTDLHTAVNLGSTSESVQAISATGRIAGEGYATGSPNYVAFTYDYPGGPTVNLGNIRADPPGWPNTNGMSADGNYLTGYLRGGVEHGWFHDGQTGTVVQPLPGDATLYPMKINNSGTFVGSSRDVLGAKTLVVYEDGVLRKVNDFLTAASSGWTLTGLADIHNDGRIAGSGTSPLGKARAVILVRVWFVPALTEAGVAALVILLAGLSCWRLRHRGCRVSAA